jgi:hypothetical protein
MTDCIFRINKSNTDSSYVAVPSNFETVGVNDILLFSAGSDVVIDDAVLSSLSEQDINRAGTILSPISSVIVAKYFLEDIVDDILREIHLAGNQNKRYVFCCSFDGETASIPQLEVWDDADLDSYLLTCLGAGVPNLSWYKGKCTTNGLPGDNWVGTPLAGSGASNTVLLDTGVLSGAKDLYFNFKVIFPAGVSTPSGYMPMFAISYLTN